MNDTSYFAWDVVLSSLAIIVAIASVFVNWFVHRESVRRDNTLRRETRSLSEHDERVKSRVRRIEEDVDELKREITSVIIAADENDNLCVALVDLERRSYNLFYEKVAAQIDRLPKGVFAKEWRDKFDALCDDLLNRFNACHNPRSDEGRRNATLREAHAKLDKFVCELVEAERALKDEIEGANE